MMIMMMNQIEMVLILGFFFYRYNMVSSFFLFIRIVLYSTGKFGEK